MITTLKEYAANKYDRAGWDYFTECYTDSDWDSLIAECKTLAACKKEMRIRAGCEHDRAEACDFEY